MEITDAVERAIRENKGFVVILAGSDSDKPHIDTISQGLTGYQIPHQTRICSAHKQGEQLTALVQKYDAIPGALAYVAVAGGTDALSGAVSFISTRPVISCPPDAPNESCLKNPPGSSNAYIARPANAARFVAQSFSHLPDTPYRALLQKEIGEKVGKLVKADAAMSVFPYEVKK